MRTFDIATQQMHLNALSETMDDGLKLLDSYATVCILIQPRYFEADSFNSSASKLLS